MTTDFQINVKLDWEKSDVVFDSDDSLEREDITRRVYERLADRLQEIAEKIRDGYRSGVGDLYGDWHTTVVEPAVFESQIIETL